MKKKKGLLAGRVQPILTSCLLQLNLKLRSNVLSSLFLSVYRALCELIGEKTDVYSLEVSMWGHDVKVRKELSKRELAKLGLQDGQKMPLEDKTISYTKEDCRF